MTQTRLSFFLIVSVFLLCSLACKEQDTLVRETPPAETEAASIVDRHGRLRVSGNRIVDKNNAPFALRGMSLFWSQWKGKYYNPGCIQWLADDWQCTVVRAALGLETDGYLENPETETKKIRDVIDACIAQGIYVIVDWHDHHAEDHAEEAVAFFSMMAELYGNFPNIIYEIYNEPLKVSWSNVIKPYAEKVIQAIREKDPDNLILVGTPEWSQRVDQAAADPIDDQNIAYVIHFYAGTHQKWLRDRALTALNQNIALFASEWGACEADGNGPLYIEETERWIAFMDSLDISWCNWAISDKQESASALKPGATASGGWIDAQLTESGKYIRAKIRGLNGPLFAD